MWEKIRKTTVWAKQQEKYPTENLIKSLKKFGKKHLSASEQQELIDFATKASKIASSGCQECAKLMHEETMARPVTRNKEDPEVC